VALPVLLAIVLFLNSYRLAVLVERVVAERVVALFFTLAIL